MRVDFDVTILIQISLEKNASRAQGRERKKNEIGVESGEKDPV